MYPKKAIKIVDIQNITLKLKFNNLGIIFIFGAKNLVTKLALLRTRSAWGIGRKMFELWISRIL